MEGFRRKGTQGPPLDAFSEGPQADLNCRDSFSLRQDRPESFYEYVHEKREQKGYQNASPVKKEDARRSFPRASVSTSKKVIRDRYR